jgi:DNA-binding transcriptional regulator YiaG
MTNDNLSIADRWMRNYEKAHPEVLQQALPRARPEQNVWKPSSSSRELNTPSPPSNNGGNACLWSESQSSGDQLIDPVVLAAIDARKSLKLTQATFARCLGLSARTVSEWEQGRRQPSGAARTLLHWVAERPDFLKQALKAYRQDKAKC